MCSPKILLIVKCPCLLFLRSIIPPEDIEQIQSWYFILGVEQSSSEPQMWYVDILLRGY